MVHPFKNDKLQYIVEGYLTWESIRNVCLMHKAD